MATLLIPRNARLLAAALAAMLAAPAAAASGPAAATAAPPAFHVPAPLMRTLPNGLRVVVFPEHGLPIVQMQLLLPGGVAEEPAGSAGVAGATAELLRAGTSSRPAEVFAADVDRLGGSINASASRDFSTVSGVFLAADFDAGLELLADATVNPIFPDESIARFRMQSGNLLLRVRMDPNALADAQLWSWAFEGHPYGRPLLGSLESLARLDREAVRAFHRDHYRPDRAVLAIAGDVDPERAFAAAADRFGNWAGRAAAPAPIEVLPAATPAPRIRIVDRAGVDQSEVRIGFVGPGRASPDFLALQLANFILGAGGFSSRLIQSLRVDGGLSYDVRSSYTALREAGLVSLGAAVRTDSVATLLNRLRDEVRRLATQTPSEAEVAAARRYFQNGYPLQFETLGALIAQWSAADFFGLPAGALDQYVVDVGAVTAARVGEAVRRWLDPQRMTVVVVGPAASLKGPLEALGTVEVVTPESQDQAAQAPAVPGPTPEQLKRGRELRDRMLAAHGGLERLRRVKDSTISGDMTFQIGGRDLTVTTEQVRKDPWRMVFNMRLPQMQNGQTLEDRRGWLYTLVSDTLSVTEADSASVEAMRMAFTSDIVHTLLAVTDSAAVAVWRGPGAAVGREADLLEVTWPAPAGWTGPDRRLLYLDPQDHRIIAVDQGESPTRPGTFEVRRVYRDYRVVEGIQWPFHEERLLSGTRTTIILIQSVALNRGVPDATFSRPTQRQGERLRR